MDLRERLRLLKVAGAGRARRDGDTPSSARPEGNAVPTEFGRIGELEGFVKSTSAGETFFVENRYPIEYCRGPVPLEACFAVPGTAWEILGRVPPTVDLRQAAFFDTETTGLAGGTGTYAFLVGIGFFRDYEFIVRQYFLRDYPEEDALLAAVAEDLAPAQTLVTFNGKSFDWPLMETRYRLARRRVPLGGVPHLDLLHPARRIWRERLGACNLTNLEAEVLGVRRMGDVPGHLIPQLYFDYLRTGETAAMGDVILHNRLDIISLVSLAAWLGRMVVDPFGQTPDGELVGGDDLFALGRLFDARGQTGRALACYEAAPERGLNAVSDSRVLRELSQTYKRLRQHDRALSVWTQLASHPSAGLYPVVEMAKYYEHVTRDYAAAREMALLAVEIADRRRSMSGGYGPVAMREWQEARHRLERVERKLQDL